MRLAPLSEELPNPAAGDRTLDEILAGNADRVPDAHGLFAPDLPFAGSWREVDRAVSSLAATFAGWGLGEDAVVGVQLGSTPHAALTCLALWRAGLVPAMLPLPWRRREIGAALASVGATAIVASARAGGADLAAVACEVAAGLETIRFVGCFGELAPDGATPLDEALDRPAARHERPDRPDDAADHVAIVTFEAGGAPVARSHNELAAAALGPILAARLTPRASLVSTLDLAGLAGLSTGLVPWLLSSGCATFHAASTAEAMSEAVAGAVATHIALPGRLAATVFAEAELGGVGLSAIAVWRAPDGRGAAADLPGASAIVDAIAFGELGLHAVPRPDRQRHSTLPLGLARVEGADALMDFKIGAEGRLALRGPACPKAPCPAHATAPTVDFDGEGYVETGISAIADVVARRIALGGRRRGVAQVGGLSLLIAEAEAAFRRTGVRGLPLFVDDPLFGARLTLAGADAAQTDAAAEMIEAAGFSPAVAPALKASELQRKSA